MKTTLKGKDRRMEDRPERSSIFNRPFSTFSLSSSVARWGPVLLWMTGILYFSSRSHPLDPLSRSADSLGIGVMGIGKVAHFTEYAGLVALVYRALTYHQEGDRGKEEEANKESAVLAAFPSLFPFLVPLSLCLLYALFDELYQEFIPGRNFALVDLGYDLAGIIFALGAICISDRLTPLGTGGFWDSQLTHRMRGVLKADRDIVGEEQR